jgi:hypothetical protein
MKIGDRVVQFPGLPSEMFGSLIEFRPMKDREGKFPVVRWDCGYEAFSSPEWGLKKVSTRVERLKERISKEFIHCSVIQEGSQIYILTPGARFRLCGRKLEPYIPSPRYKTLTKIITEIWNEST